MLFYAALFLIIALGAALLASAVWLPALPVLLKVLPVLLKFCSGCFLPSSLLVSSWGAAGVHGASDR